MEIKSVAATDLEKDLGISKQKFSNWKSGLNEPRPEILKELAAYLKVPMKMFYEENLTEDALTGSSSKSPKPSTIEKSKIPFYDAAVVGGTTMLAEQNPISQPSEFIDPGDLLRGATGTLRVYGQSMFPKYPSGCIIAFKASQSEVIIWGEDYVIELSDRRIIKRVVKSQEKDCIKAVSYNMSNDKYVYEPIDIPRTEIKRLYMVVGKVEMEASI